MVWAASNITYLYIVLGGTMVLLGLNAWQSLAVVVAGNLFWGLVGWLSVSGPSSGTPSEVVTRAMFGIRGNRVYNIVLGWGVGVAYEAHQPVPGRTGRVRPGRALGRACRGRDPAVACHTTAAPGDAAPQVLTPAGEHGTHRAPGDTVYRAIKRHCAAISS